MKRHCSGWDGHESLSPENSAAHLLVRDWTLADLQIMKTRGLATVGDGDGVKVRGRAPPHYLCPQCPPSLPFEG